MVQLEQRVDEALHAAALDPWGRSIDPMRRVSRHPARRTRLRACASCALGLMRRVRCFVVALGGAWQDLKRFICVLAWDPLAATTKLAALEVSQSNPSLLCRVPHVLVLLASGCHS